MQPCDLLISAAYMLPVAPENVVLENHAMAIVQGAIVDIAPQAELMIRYTAQETIDLSHHIVLPGLVNAHGHAAMSLLRGAGEDQPLQEWLSDTIWPLEAQHVDTDAVALGTELAIGEMLQSGTTTFSDMYFFPDVVAQTASKFGMRCQVAFPVIKFPNVYSDDAQDGIHKGLALHDAYRHDPLVQIAFGPHAAYTVDHGDLEKVAMYANELNAGVQIHLHENAAEVAEAQLHQGHDWIQALSEIGLLGPQLQAVHMTQLTPKNIDLVAQSDTQVVHCPSSNMKLASGYCPVSQLRAQGINVGLGTDGAASNNSLDMFNEIHLAALLMKHESQDASLGRAVDMIKMATLDSAQVLGIANLTGSLEPGKQADFITLDCHSLNTLPLHDPFATVVHSNAGRAVQDVYIAGQAQVSDGKLVRIDANDLAERVTGWHAAIQ
jgi:5-methylthioadenosine/S-adenosylhomocysteine deaminase